jgi:hypothetical protein
MFHWFTRGRIRSALTFSAVSAAAAVAVFAPSSAFAVSMGAVSSLTISEGDVATALVPAAAVTGSETLFNYSIDVTLDDSTTKDIIGLETTTTPATANGEVSISNGVVYVGDGSNARRIGEVDAVKTGGANKPLRITFDSEFLQNPDFRAGNTTGWTVSTNRVNLGTDLIGGFQSYFADEGTSAFTSAATPDRDDAGGTTYPDLDNDVLAVSGGSDYRIGMTMTIDADVTSTDTVFNGLTAYTDEFTAHQGERVSFTYRNCLPPDCGQSVESNGSPIYRMWVALERTDPGISYQNRWTTLLNWETADNTGWFDTSGAIPATGHYRIVVVSGASWDAAHAGRHIAKTQFRLDDFKLTPTITTAVVQKVMRLITYQNTSKSPSGTRTAHLVLGASSTTPVTTNVTISVTDDPTTSEPVAPPTRQPGSSPQSPPVAPVVAPPAEPTEPSAPEVPAEPAAAPEVSPVPSLGEVIANLFAPPSIDLDIAGAKANPALGATGNDAAPPAPFNAMSSPESVAAVSAQAALAAAMAAAVAGAAAAAARGGSSDSSGGETSGGELGGLDVGSDSLSLNHVGWGDRLPLFAGAALAGFDRFSSRIAERVAPLSPLAAKLITDGAYVRAMFGFLSILLPLASAVIAVIATSKSHGELAATGWILLVTIAVLGVLDAGAGVIGGLILVGGAMVQTGWPDVSELRAMFGILLITIGPALIMTAFRPIRKLVSSNFTGAWERITDLAVGPFMAGTTVATMVAVLPAVAGLTMPIANHVLGFGLLVTGAAILRVLLEEVVTRVFPARLNRNNPDEIPEPPMVQKIFKLLVAYGIWVLVTGAIIGPVWQSWIGSIFFLLPAVIGLFADRFPNVPFLWRLLPQGIPGLAFGVVLSTVVALLLLSTLGANPESAAWIIVILPLPSLALGIMSMFGQHGKAGEVRISQRSALLFRLGGVVMFVVTLRLMGVI